MARPLKAGTVADFGGSMAEYIETAMKNEWRAIRKEELPERLGEADRRILFTAVAQGVLKYLYDHRSDLITDSGGEGPNSHRHAMDFDVATDRTIFP
jgi:hypothetical protein